MSQSPTRTTRKNRVGLPLSRSTELVGTGLAPEEYPDKVNLLRNRKDKDGSRASSRAQSSSKLQLLPSDEDSDDDAGLNLNPLGTIDVYDPAMDFVRQVSPVEVSQSFSRGQTHPPLSPCIGREA
ncbi:Hypothetical predicted protein [Drosophila guanche]|uniref:Uncharacterized protein n=1 Tax=Drosophila guanche TaxID=7266 RepID=A0A3B0JU93_DROGU|nr:Hypothetical predicted protein [Drosophila guanche]